MTLRLTLLAALLLIPCALSAQVSDQARQLHDDAFVFDGHVHVINRQLYLGGDLGERYADGQVDLPRIREGGIDALFFVVLVSEQYYPPRFETKQALRLIDLAHRQIEKNSGKIELALSASDIERINRAGKTAAILDLEGGFDLDGDLAILRSLYKLGLRVVQLPAHNWANEFADSCCAKPRWGGLNDHGRDVVREMNRLGMVINVSHSSDQTLEQAIETSADPVVATHHGLRRFNDIPRVMPDHLLKKLAAKGGVIGFHIGHSFHFPDYHAWRTKRSGRTFWDTTEIGKKEAEMSIFDLDRIAAKGYPSVGSNAPDDVRKSVEDWLAVIEYAIDLVGEDHVAIGSDFDGGPTPPREMKDISDMPAITEAMIRRGWSEARMREFLGGNLLRVFRQVTDE
jgi:membrane dipeptidase